MYAATLEKGKTLDFTVGPNRQAYLVVVEGAADTNGVHLNTRDALEIIEENITISAQESAYCFVIERKKASVAPPRLFLNNLEASQP